MGVKCYVIVVLTLQERLDRWDMDEVTERLRQENPLFARVFALRRDDHSLSEIA